MLRYAQRKPRQTFATQLAIILPPQKTSKDAQANFENLPGHNCRTVGDSGEFFNQLRGSPGKAFAAKVRNMAGHHFRNVEEPSSGRYDTQNMGITIHIFFGARSWA